MRRLLCAGVVLVGLLLCSPLVRTASAEVTNNGLSCIATLNNSSASGRSSSDTAEAIDVDSGTSVEVRMTADKTITHYTVQMGWGDVTPWTAADNSASGTGWAQRVNVDQYAKYGIGLYRVSATTVGPDGSCTMAALVNVHGQPIPNTVAGDAAGGLALASGLLFGATAASAASGGGDGGSGGGGGGGNGESEDGDDDFNPYAGPDERVARSLIPPDMRPVVCWSALPMALMLTALAVMGVVGAPGGSARPASVYRRAHWRPMFSVASILSALVGALSVVVLLQQYGRLQPTTRVLITAGVAALLVAIVVPSLLRLIPVSRYNRRVARREAARAARPGGPPPGSPPPGYPPAGYPPAGSRPAG